MAIATQKAPDTTTKPRGPVVTKIGNLCADPELQFGKSGKAFARMRIAVTTPKVVGDWAGERETAFYDVTAFGTLAEHVAESLTKGDRIVVTGAGEVREYQNKAGETVKAKGILADALGPDLRWSTAQVVRAIAERPQPAPVEGDDDEEPF